MIKIHTYFSTKQWKQQFLAVKLNAFVTNQVQVLLLVGIPIFLFASSLAAQKTGQSSYAKSYFSNALEIWPKKGAMTKEKWVSVAGTCLFTGAAITLDDAVNSTALKWQTNFANDFGKIGNITGSLQAQLGLSSLAIGVGAISGESRIKQFGLDNMQAQTYVTVATILLKNLSHRSRPNANKGEWNWQGPFSGWGDESFVSGHSALAFSTATMVYLHSGRKWWVGLASYSIASAIGISRIQQSNHWVSDVAGGAIIGTLLSNYIFAKQEQRRKIKFKQKKILP